MKKQIKSRYEVITQKTIFKYKINMKYTEKEF